MLLLVTILVFSAGFLVACDEPTETAPVTNGTETTYEEEGPAAISFGDTFTFDNLEITFGSDVTWGTLENQFSDLDGEDVFMVPITIVNIGDDTHGLNMFFFTQFGPDGNNLDDVSAFFMDEDVSFAGDMRSGATQESVMVFHYVGDGDYIVEFSELLGDTTEVVLPIAQ